MHPGGGRSLRLFYRTLTSTSRSVLSEREMRARFLVAMSPPADATTDKRFGPAKMRQHWCGVAKRRCKAGVDARATLGRENGELEDLGSAFRSLGLRGRCRDFAPDTERDTAPCTRCSEAAIFPHYPSLAPVDRDAKSMKAIGHEARAMCWTDVIRALTHTHGPQARAQQQCSPRTHHGWRM